MFYYSTKFRDRSMLGPRDVAGEIGFAQGDADQPRVGYARGHSLIPRDYHTDRPAEVLWKLQLGTEELPGLWTLRMGQFACHHPNPDDDEAGLGDRMARLARRPAVPADARPAREEAESLPASHVP